MREAVSMKPDSAGALEDVVARRLEQVKEDDALIRSLVCSTNLWSSAKVQGLDDALSRLTQRKKILQEQIGRLVVALAEGGAEIKAIGEKLVELEEQKDGIQMEIDEARRERMLLKTKVADAVRLKTTLEGFSDIYGAATPEEQKEALSGFLNGETIE